MIPLYTCEEMRTAERDVIAAGIPGRVLMENAASAAWRILQKESPAEVLVFCGSGNCAGDGFALSRRLFISGTKTKIILVGDTSRLSSDAAENLAAAKKLGVPILDFDEICEERPQKGTYIADAILGIGLSREVSGKFRAAIEYINDSGCDVLSLDLPSGISGDTGRVFGCAVRATKTITFGLRKLGLYSPLAADFTGEILFDDISIPAPESTRRFLLGKKDIALPRASRAAHKGVNGHAVILGGSVGMAGAPTLAAESAEIGGAGLVTVQAPEALLPILMRRLTGAMCAPFSAPLPEKTNAVLIGPGLGREETRAEILEKGILEARGTLILDADGLYHLAGDLSLLQKATCPVILTPHMGEMARLCGLSAAEITENRVEVAERFAKEHGVTVVLKGAYTVVAEPEGKTYINMTGNAGMAKGGSGDILAGLITGLAASGVPHAAAAAVFLHGLAGDLAAQTLGERAMRASSLVKFLPKAIKCM